MKLIRRPPSAPFGTLARETLHSPDLTLKEKGMMAVVFSLPEDWDFSVSGLASILNESKGAIQATLRNLKAKGYLSENLVRNGIGQILKREYIFHESLGQDSQEQENPQMDNPSLENQPQHIRKELKEEQTKKETTMSKLFKNQEFVKEWNEFIRKRGPKYTEAMKAEDLAALEKYPIGAAICIVRNSTVRGWARAHYSFSGKMIAESWERLEESGTSVFTKNESVKQALKRKGGEKEKGGAQ